MLRCYRILTVFRRAASVVIDVGDTAPMEYCLAHLVTNCFYRKVSREEHICKGSNISKVKELMREVK